MKPSYTPVPSPYSDPAFAGRVTGMTGGVQTPGDPEPGGTTKAIRYDAQVVTGGYDSQAKFVHIVINVTNSGATGIELIYGNRANFALPNGYAFYMNDGVDVAQIPYYPTTPNVQLDPNPNPYGIRNYYTFDTPGFSVNIGKSALKRMDLTFEAKVYIVWTYQDGTLYPLGWGSYRTVFAGDIQADNTFKVRTNDPAGNNARTEVIDGENSNDEPAPLIGPLYNPMIKSGAWVKNVP